MARFIPTCAGFPVVAERCCAVEKVQLDKGRSPNLQDAVKTCLR